MISSKDWKTALHCDRIVVSKKFVGDDIGCDHFPVIVDFGVRP